MQADTHTARLLILGLAAALSLTGCVGTPPHPPRGLHPVRLHTDRQGARLLPLPKADDCFFFAVFGDRTSGKPEGLPILSQAVEDVNLLDPDLVMTVGDLVQGYGSAADWMAQMRDFRERMGKLRMPWYPVAGNHDTYGPLVEKERRADHAGRYETHFGPLWYWFEHKNCAFVVLYSDEGDPVTGQVSFKDPKAQRMSPEQLAWLERALAANRGRDHVFVFLHHPRWRKGGYGDDWDRVHRVLAAAGNVTAVFAGHIHKMVYDGVRDGIEYFTLAVTGGNLTKDLPAAAGYLHHFNLVTVRKSGIRVSTIPVGAVLDPRAITPEVSDQVRALNGRLAPQPQASVRVAADGAVDDRFVFAVTNPTTRPVEYTWVPACVDPRWRFEPDHRHATVAAGATVEVSFAVRRPAGRDGWFGKPELRVQADYLAPGLRITLHEKTVPIPLLEAEK